MAADDDVVVVRRVSNVKLTQLTHKSPNSTVAWLLLLLTRTTIHIILLSCLVLLLLLLLLFQSHDLAQYESCCREKDDIISVSRVSG